MTLTAEEKADIAETAHEAAVPGGEKRDFRVGTAGWTVDDLNDPEILRQWTQGRYEIVEGVLTLMAPQGIGGIGPLSKLRNFLYDHTRQHGFGGEFMHEVDVLMRPRRVPRPDMVYLTPEQEAEQAKTENDRGVSGLRYRPLYVMPTLIVESVSRGYEAHDRITKREWYAEGGVPHYWILDADEQSLECLTLDGTGYRTEARGVRPQTITASLLGGLQVPLERIWPNEA